MNPTTIHIKNMVCKRCIKVIIDEFAKLVYIIDNIKLGKVNLTKELSDCEIEIIWTLLLENSFELINDKKSKIIDRI